MPHLRDSFIVAKAGNRAKHDPSPTRYHQTIMPDAKTTAEKPPIYLLDSMAFIFRAYHAMQRQRPMSTRTGIPTAATYVFVNMINKLRKDFQPHYLAAVYDLSGPVFRDERAKEMKGVKKFNIKTQQFEVIDYAGYKANRAEMPQDLAQQLPFIRRALEAFRIPILSYEGFEADDVIGTLSCKLSEQGHKVFVVSSDKDMMQLVNSGVSILNPTKDNLILDPAGVENILGVPPERVIDVMALRGDAIDNIPGAPGIGDKGSVELIQQFGTVEAALDRADEVKRKTYRESLQNNRENILLSKELVTIHTGVPIDYSIDDMLTQLAGQRRLPRTLLRTRIHHAAQRSGSRRRQHAHRLQHQTHSRSKSPLSSPKPAAIDQATGQPHGLALAIFEDARAIAEEIAAEPSEESGEPEPPPAENLSLFGAPEPAANPGAPFFAVYREGWDVNIIGRPSLQARPRRRLTYRHRSLPRRSRHQRSPPRPRPAQRRPRPQGRPPRPPAPRHHARRGPQRRHAPQLPRQPDARLAHARGCHRPLHQPRPRAGHQGRRLRKPAG